MSASMNASFAFGRPLFELGSICMTEGVCDLVGNGLLRPAPLVLRHVSGDWGEMDAEDLWNTTMDPEQRTLAQVTLEDAAAASDMFSILMGEDVEQRRNFIQRNAKDVRFLDI